MMGWRPRRRGAHLQPLAASLHRGRRSWLRVARFVASTNVRERGEDM